MVERIHKIVYETKFTIAGIAKGILREGSCPLACMPGRHAHHGPINISRENVKGRKANPKGTGGGREPATHSQASACNRFAPGERARCCALFNSTRYCTVTHHRFPSDVAPHMTLQGTNLSSSRTERFLPGSRQLPNTQRTVRLETMRDESRVARETPRVARVFDRVDSLN